MNNHIMLKHKSHFQQVASTSSSSNSAVDMVPAPVAGPSSIAGSSSVSTVQQTLQDSFLTKWDIKDPRAKQIHGIIAEMIAVDNQPISILKDEGINRLLHVLKPKYKTPGRKYMSEVIIPDIYEKVKNAIRKELCKVMAVTITTDMWTCLNNMISFISFTAHWLDENFVLHHRVLQMKNFRESHTGDNIRAVLEEMCAAWEIHNKVHLIIRDNGRNIVKAINESSFVGKGCFIHTLQLAIKGCLQINNIDEALISARRIVTHFNHSAPAQAKLREIQSELNLPEHLLVQDVTTRWNSTYYMCERLVEQKRAISLYISDNPGANVQNLTERQWQIIRECLILLKPFEEITKITSSTFSSISEVIPHSNTLKKYLNKPEILHLCQNIMVGARKLQDEVECRFRGLEEDKSYCLATLLDPRFRTRFFSPEKCEVVRKMVLLEAIKRSEYNESSSETELDIINDNNDPAARPLQDVTNYLEETHVAFWDCYEELASSKPVQSENSKSPIAVELDSYIQENLLPRTNSPYDWWAKHKTKYAHLANLARIFLSAPGSSIYSERLFSEAGNVYEEKRNRLLPDRAESLVFLHHNLPLLDYKY